MPVTLVTGTSTGIGLATALHFARRGHQVVATMRNLAKAGPLETAAHGEKLPVVVRELDVTRPESLQSLPQWYEIVASVAGPVPAVVLANKSDREGTDSVPRPAIEEVCSKLQAPWFETSAKTGANVDAAFRRAAVECLLEARKTWASGVRP